MKNDLKARTFKFSLDVISLVEMLPKNQATGVVSYQILKSGTSVGANYRAAKRGRSDKEFISKINIVLKEADELTAIFTSTLITMNRKKGRN